MALKRAELMHQIIGGEASQLRRIKKDLEEFQEEHHEFEPPMSDIKILKEMGGINIQDITETKVKKEVGLYDPVFGFFKDEKGRLYTLSAFMEHGNKGSTPDSSYILHTRTRQGGGSDSRAGAHSNGNNIVWSNGTGTNNYHFDAESEKLSDKRFNMKVRFVKEK